MKNNRKNPLLLRVVKDTFEKCWALVKNRIFSLLTSLTSDNNNNNTSSSSSYACACRSGWSPHFWTFVYKRGRNCLLLPDTLALIWQDCGRDLGEHCSTQREALFDFPLLNCMRAISHNLSTCCGGSGDGGVGHFTFYCLCPCFFNGGDGVLSFLHITNPSSK